MFILRQQAFIFVYIESTRNWRITYLFYFVLKFLGFLKTFIHCAYLSVNFESRKMPPGKIVSRKKDS